MLKNHENTANIDEYIQNCLLLKQKKKQKSIETTACGNLRLGKAIQKCHLQ